MLDLALKGTAKTETKYAFAKIDRIHFSKKQPLQSWYSYFSNNVAFINKGSPPPWPPNPANLNESCVRLRSKERWALTSCHEDLFNWFNEEKKVKKARRPKTRPSFDIVLYVAADWAFYCFGRFFRSILLGLFVGWPKWMIAIRLVELLAPARKCRMVK